MLPQRWSPETVTMVSSQTFGAVEWFCMRCSVAIYLLRTRRPLIFTRKSWTLNIHYLSSFRATPKTSSQRYLWLTRASESQLTASNSTPGTDSISPKIKTITTIRCPEPSTRSSWWRWKHHLASARRVSSAQLKITSIIICPPHITSCSRSMHKRVTKVARLSATLLCRHALIHNITHSQRLNRQLLIISSSNPSRTRIIRRDMRVQNLTIRTQIARKNRRTSIQIPSFLPKLKRRGHRARPTPIIRIRRITSSAVRVSRQSALRLQSKTNWS